MALFGNGLLNGQQQQPMPQMPRVPWSQNPLVTSIGLGLLGGRNINEGFANAAAAAPAGMVAKTTLQAAMQKRQDDEAAKAAQRAAWNAGMRWKSNGGDWGGLSPEDQAALSAAPEIASKFMPKEADLPTSYQEYLLGTKDPAFTQHQIDMKQAGRTTVNNNVGSTNKYAETVDTGIANDFLDMQKQGRSATETKTALSAMEGLMNDPNFYSGAGAETSLGLKRAMVALGGDPNMTASTEAFNALAKKAALDNMGGSLGTGFSNADRDFITEQVPTLSNTPEGNKALITINKKLAERKEQVAKMARDYANQNNGRIDYAFYDKLAQWAEENPLFPQRQQEVPGGGGQGQPQIIPQLEPGGSVTLPDGTVIERVD